MLKSFAQQHAEALSAGMIASTLPSCDVPMISCPATPTQSLLANIVQIGRICPSLNGSDPSKIYYPDASFFFDSIATLVDAVPLGTFSSRDSAVEWISTSNGHHTPIVLSPLVTDQCKLLLVDSFVRNLFDCAIDDEALGTASVLRTKNDKDLKLEKDMAEVATASATSLAASEAMVDRNKSFWKSSKWARKLSSSMTKVFSNENTDASKNRSRSSVDGGQGMLIDTSSVSKKLAHGGPHDRSVTNAFLAEDKVKKYAAITNAEKAATPALYSSELLLSLCRVYAIVLARWNGIGHDDIVAGTRWEDPRNEDRKARATSKADPLTHMLLNVLCFSTTVIRTTWALTQSDPNVISDLYSVIDEKKSALPIRATTVRPVYSASMGTRKGNGGVGEAVLLLCVSCLSHGLIVTDDVEIHEMDKPLPLHQLRRCIQLLKQLLYRACCLDDKNSRLESNYFGLALISASSRTMRDLYDRSSRRPLCVPKGWLIEDLLDKELKQCKTASQYEALLALPVLRVCPFLVSFKRRLKLFERIVTLTRIEIQGINDQNPFNSNPLKPGIPVRIMRTRLLEDGLATMNNLGQNMRQRIVVHYTNEAGVQEIGIDAGGLFKEFWTDLSQLAFDPNYALFRVTEGNCLYPNPSSFAAHGSDHITLFEFLGRILGKSLFEGITVHPQFAHFFLSFLRGEYNFLHQFSDLSTMDVQLYNNLMFLKTYEGDAEELCLTFTVANDDFGGNKEVPLIPNGADIVVTNANKHRYIGLVAKHHVCDRVRVQSEAFRRGLWEVISPSWLRIFNEPELQVLISGPSDGKIDIEDMRSNSRYAGGYTPIDRNVVRFWKVVGSLSSKQQAALLRFVTSCERPPPLGFSTLNPPFTIQRVGILRDGDKLPSASTCFNVLKLPTYSSEKVLRQRLIYAIESGAGFELT
jgi:ubiquitin-protein ligase E3 C